MKWKVKGFVYPLLISIGLIVSWILIFKSFSDFTTLALGILVSLGVAVGLVILPFRGFWNMMQVPPFAPKEDFFEGKKSWSFCLALGYLQESSVGQRGTNTRPYVVHVTDTHMVLEYGPFFWKYIEYYSLQEIQSIEPAVTVLSFGAARVVIHFSHTLKFLSNSLYFRSSDDRQKFLEVMKQHGVASKTGS